MAGYNITITSGAQGAPGADGEGVPSGGTTGQFLKKNSGTDYDTIWSDSSATVNSINDINDVDVTGVTNDQVLQYNSTSGNWEATTLASGGTWGSITGTLSNQTDLQSALDAKAASSHTHLMADITDSTWISDYTVTEGDVTAHQAALTITESQISDLGSYLTDITSQSIKSLSDVFTSMTPSDGQVLTYDTTNGWQAETPSGGGTWGSITGTLSNQIDLQSALNGKSDTGHTHVEADITDLQAYLLNITSESISSLSDVNVTTPAVRHALMYDGVDSWDNRLLVEADISDLQSYLTSVSWGDIAGTLSNQIDLQSALNGKSDTGHTHVMANITDSTWISDITGENLADLSDIPSITGNANKLLKVNATEDGYIWGDPSGTTVSWGDIAGTLSNQTDLQSALDGKAASSHTHTLSDVTDAGTIASQDADAVAITGGDADLTTLQLLGGTGNQGTLGWNTDEETVDLIQNGTTLQLGQEIQYNVRNNTGSTITNGTPVMATGTLGASGRITIAPMDGTSQSNSKLLLGIATEDIANGVDGKVTHFGKIRQLDTTGTLFGGSPAETWSDGDIVYIDTVNVGSLTNVAPTSGMKMAVAIVIYANANGTLFTRVNNLDENAFATTAQGALADSATQPGDNISTLTNDSGFITGYTVTEGDVTAHQAALSITESQISDLGTYIPSSEKAATNGVATLDGSGLIPTNQLPGLAITSTQTAASEVAQLALTVQEGDVCVRTDESKTYIALNADNVDMGDWQELLTPTDSVTSVDSRTGAVTLSDLYAPIVHTHLMADITDADWISNITAESIGDLSDVNVATPAVRHALMYDGVDSWDNRLLVEADISDLGSYLTAETNDLTAAVTWANVPDANITQTSVSQHQAALSITESQISDLQNYQERTTATLQTTDATSTVLSTTAIPTGEEKIIRVRVHGHENATNDHIWKTMTFCVKNVGGTATQVGGIDSATGYDTGATSWAIVAGVSTGNATITVTGEAAHTIDWRATIEVD